MLSHYDAEIRYVDRHVGRVLDALRERGIYDETTVVLTADHGEEFGEHGLYREHWSTYDGTQRVPLVVKPPADEQVEPGGRDHLVTNVDLAPTIAAYAGLRPPAVWQGDSLRSIVGDDDVEWRNAIVVDHGLYTAQRAVRTDRWKFVRTYDAGMWEGVLPDRQLFDVATDPWEQDDVSDRHSVVVESLETRMVEWAEERRGRDEDSLRATAREGPEGASWGGEFDGV